ncbi:MAG: nucleoside deaminase [Bryobacterales bacterium]|nr:nucleoside deaminase [Bryobacterales bacterium]
MSDAHFIRRAIDLAVENVRLGRGGPFGAVIVHDGVVVAEGANLVTHSHDPTAHAEIVAIREACRIRQSFELRGCTIYSSCEPCPMCLGAIYWARLYRLVFASTRDDAAEAGFDDSFIYQQVPLAPDARSLPMTNLLREEGARAFQAWRQSPGHIAY